jgi:ribosomal subunit interface protein
MLRLTVNSVHSSIDEDLKKYVGKKIGKLDKYIPRKMRGSAHAQIFLKEFKVKNKKQCTCEVIMFLPHEEFVTKETTMNIFAAVDIVEAKLKNQLRKYKDTHLSRSRQFIRARSLRRRNY